MYIVASIREHEFRLTSPFFLQTLAKNPLHRKITMQSTLRLIEWIPLYFCANAIVCASNVASFNWNAFVERTNVSFDYSASFSGYLCVREKVTNVYDTSNKCKKNLLACFLHHFTSTETANLAKCVIAIDNGVIDDLGICQQERTIRCKEKIERKFCIQ